MKDHYTHELLTGVLASLGLDASASGSKRERVAAALAGLGPETVARVAVEAGQGMGDLALADSGECFLEEGRPPLSEITRRDVARCFGHDLAGSRDLVEMLRPLFILEDPATMFIAGSLADDLRRFASGAEPAWDAERVFTEIGALTCSRARFFAEYFRQLRGALGDRLPALVPQVYLHYDPETVRRLAGRDGLVRQRMDFLLLLPNRQRIVLEVDGRQHFAARDGSASLDTYAVMVSADRDLRLAGYEVFRFGANEVVGRRAAGLIGSFFMRLFELHGVR